jgi:shikimate dehydrogenase
MTEEIPGLPLPLTGATRLFAIIGDPIAQAGSPRLFNSAFRDSHMEAVLVPIHVETAGLPALLAAFRSSLNFDGIVVTVPHKFAVMELIDELGPMARRVGAVNAIRKQPDGRLLGDNFDGVGFVHGLMRRGHSLVGKRVLIIGAGGAGCSVAHAILDQNPAAIGLFDIDAARMDSLVGSLRETNAAIPVATAMPDPADYDVVVNCTVIGMRPSDPYPVRVESLRPTTLVVDIILKPQVTPLLTEAARRGCATHEGVHMLEGQVRSVCEFFGVGR